jgi:hypothetical protein
MKDLPLDECAPLCKGYCVGRNYVPDLRRTFATRLRASGVHEYDLSDLLGHARTGDPFRS